MQKLIIFWSKGCPFNHINQDEVNFDQIVTANWKLHESRESEKVT